MSSGRHQHLYQSSPHSAQRRLQYSMDSENMEDLNEIDAPFDLENISRITSAENLSNDSMEERQSDRAILLQENIQQQQQIDGLNEEVERLQEQLSQREALERDGNIAQDALQKSVRGTNNYKALQNRYRALQGLSPLPDDPVEERNDNRTPEASFTGGEWPVSPIAASYPIEKFNAIDAFDRSLDNVLKFSKEAQERPMATSDEGSESDRSYHDSDFFNKRIFENITIPEDDSDKRLWLSDEDSNGQEYFDVTPGILDESLYEDQPAEALIKVPEGFVRRRYPDLLNESYMNFEDVFGDEAEEVVIPSNWQSARPTRSPVQQQRSPAQQQRSPIRPQRSPFQQKETAIQSRISPVRPQRSPLLPHESSVRPERTTVQPRRSPIRSPRSAVQSQPQRSPLDTYGQRQRSPVQYPQRLHHVVISSTESTLRLSAEEEPFVLSDSSPIASNRTPDQRSTSYRTITQQLSEDQSWLDAENMTSFQSPGENESIRNRNQTARALYVPADPAVRRQLFAADDSGTFIDSEDDELPEDQRNFVWLERMVPQTGDPKHVQILSGGPERGRQRRRSPRQRSTERQRSSQNRSTERRRSGSSRLRQDRSGSRGRSVERQTDWQPPPPKVITPRMAKAIAVNQAFLEEKKRKRLAALAARQPVVPIVAAEEPIEDPTEPAPTETELLIEKLKKRMRRAKGQPKTPEAAAVSVPTVPQTLPSRMRSRSKSVGRASRSGKFEFDLNSAQHRRAIEVNRAYEEELQRKRASKSAKKGDVKSVPGRLATKPGPSVIQKFNLELSEAHYARAVEVNRLYEEEQQRIKMEKKARADAKRLLKTPKPATEPPVQQSQNRPETIRRSRPKPVDIVQQLRERMWAKLGKPALSDGDEDPAATPSVQFNEDDEANNGLPRDRHARAVEINRRYEEEQKLKNAKRAAKRTRSLPSRQSKQEQVNQPDEFKFELNSLQFARSLEVNRLYMEEKKRKKDELEAKKAKLRAAQAEIAKQLNKKKFNRAIEVNRLYEVEHREEKEKEKKKKSASLGALGKKRSKHGMRPVPGTERRVKYRTELTSPQHRRAIEVNEMYLSEVAEKRAKAEARKEARKKELILAGSKSDRKGTVRPRFLMELDKERKARAIEVNRMYLEKVEQVKREKEMQRAKRDGTWVSPPPVAPPAPTQEPDAIEDPLDLLRRRLVEQREQFIPPATETLGYNPFAAIGPHTGVPTARQLWKTPEPKAAKETPPPTPLPAEPAPIPKIPARRNRIPLFNKRGRRSEFKFDLASPQYRRALEVNRMFEEQEQLQNEAKARKRTQSVGGPARSKSSQSVRHQRAMSVGRGLSKFKMPSPRMDRALRVNEMYLQEQAVAAAKKEESKKRRAEMIALKTPAKTTSSRLKMELNPAQHARAVEVNRMYEEEQRLKAEERALRDSKRTKSLGLPPVKRSRHRLGQLPVTERKKAQFNFERTEEHRARAIEVNRQYMDEQKLKKLRREAKRAGLPWPPVAPPQPEQPPAPEETQQKTRVEYLLERMGNLPLPRNHRQMIQGPLIEGIRPQGMQLESTPPRVQMSIATPQPLPPPRPRTPIPTPPPPPRDRRAQAVEINEMYLAEMKVKKQQKRQQMKERQEREERELRPSRSHSNTRRRRTTSNYV